MDHNESVRQHPSDCVCDPCWLAYIDSLPTRWIEIGAGTPAGRREAAVVHGTPHGYNTGCRLRCCREAKRKYQAALRARRRAA